jgi:GNAT superfamily N-acetyltransferase
MKPSRGRRASRVGRALLGRLPQPWRHALFRRFVDCDPDPDPRLQLGIAATRDDLESCFALLHDAYVGSGFMKPHPSGLRVTPYHALPTTTTLYARFDGEVVGTLSIIREGVFGFPMQSAFDLAPLRAIPGRIAEISALAVHPRFRKTGGTVLFPLMKFMYEYCTRYFDTRHLVIAVNPNRIELYEALLFFRRLQAQVVDNYAFAGGAPAIGATLDLALAPELFRAAYCGRPVRKDMHRYFTRTVLPNIRWPSRPYFTTNDPVMSPALLDHFFNQRTKVFPELDERRRRLLQAIYPEPTYAAVLPPVAPQADAGAVRRHARHSLRCPGRFALAGVEPGSVPIEVLDVSASGCLVHAERALEAGTRGFVDVELGIGCHSRVAARVVRRSASLDGLLHGLQIDAPDAAWQRCIRHLEACSYGPGGAPAVAAAPAAEAPPTPAECAC